VPGSSQTGQNLSPADLAHAETTDGNWTIRPFRSDDAECLADIYRSAVRRLAARYYTGAQIDAWLSIAPKSERIAGAYGQGRTALVCAHGCKTIAFSDHDPTGHIQFIYCDPSYAGCGAADHLMNAIEASAMAQGISRLSSEASEAARRFFLRHGFEIIARRNFEINGVTIHNYAVEKHLRVLCQKKGSQVTGDLASK